MIDAILYMLAGAALAVLAVVGLSRLAGFRAQRPEDYAGRGPEFDIRRHLDGPIACEGVIYGPTGRVSARFTAEMEARWDGDRGRMSEHFTYDDGSEQKRHWDLEVAADGRIRATAPDVVGEGSGVQKGSGVRLTYRIKLPESSGGHVLDTTDWMYLLANGTVVNRSQFRKFGIPVAELIATLRPKAAEEARSLAAE